MNTLRVGLIGAGAVVREIHGPGFAAHSAVRLTAVASRKVENATAIAARYSIPHVYASYAELLADEDIDAVSICTPPATHAELAQQAVAAGKHVLLEKPIATDLNDVTALSDLARAGSVIFQVVHNERFMDLHVRIKEILKSGELGEVRAIIQTVATTGPEAWAPDADWFRNRDISGGGALMDLAVHKADLAAWLLEQDVDRVSEPLVDNWPVENVAAVTLQLGQQVAPIVASWKGPRDESSLEVLASDGMLTAVGSSGEIVVSREGVVRRESTAAPWSTQDRSPQAMIADFVDLCLSGRGLGELDLLLWDAGTRWVLESYAQLERSR